MHLVLSRIVRISLSNVVASRSFQNIFSVLYKDGLSRFKEDCCERIIEGGLLREIYRRLD